MSTTALANQKHEKFCQGVSSGLSATKAYSNVYGKGKASDAAASRLLRDVKILSRVAELKNEINTAAIQHVVAVTVTEYRSKEVRIAKLASIAEKQEKIISARAIAYAAKDGVELIPGGDTGLVVPVYGKKKAYEVDTALIREYRATLQQIESEVGSETETDDDMMRQLTAAIRDSPRE